MYQLSEDVLNQVLAYLSTKPYSEVSKLIPLIQSAERVIEKSVDAVVEGEIV